MLVLRLLVMVLTIICLMDGHAEVSSSTTGMSDGGESPAVKPNEPEVQILDRKKKKKPKKSKKPKKKPKKSKKPNKITPKPTKPVKTTPTMSTSTLKTTTVLTTPTTTTTATTTTPTTTVTTATTTIPTTATTSSLPTTAAETTTPPTSSPTTPTTPLPATASPPGECKADNGKPCIFPFKDGNEEYNKCKNKGGVYYWCPTSVYESGKYKHWSYCPLDDSCPLPGGKCKTTEKMPCIFPFKDGEKEYNECPDDGKRFWCATSTNSAGQQNNWGECKMDGSCPLEGTTTVMPSTETTTLTTPPANDTSSAIANVENTLNEINDTLQNLETAGFSEDEKQLLETMNDLSDYLETGSLTRSWNYDPVKINSWTQLLYTTTANIKASKEVNPGFISAYQTAETKCSKATKKAKLSQVNAGPGRMFELPTISEILGIITNAPSSSVCCAECKALAADSELFEHSTDQKQCDCYKTKWGVLPQTMASANLDSGVCTDKGTEEKLKLVCPDGYSEKSDAPSFYLLKDWTYNKDAEDVYVSANICASECKNNTKCDAVVSTICKGCRLLTKEDSAHTPREKVNHYCLYGAPGRIFDTNNGNLDTRDSDISTRDNGEDCQGYYSKTRNEFISDEHKCIQIKDITKIENCEEYCEGEPQSSFEKACIGFYYEHKCTDGYEGKNICLLVIDGSSNEQLQDGQELIENDVLTNLLKNNDWLRCKKVDCTAAIYDSILKPSATIEDKWEVQMDTVKEFVMLQDEESTGINDRVKPHKENPFIDVLENGKTKLLKKEQWDSVNGKNTVNSVTYTPLPKSDHHLIPYPVIGRKLKLIKDEFLGNKNKQLEMLTKIQESLNFLFFGDGNNYKKETWSTVLKYKFEDVQMSCEKSRTPRKDLINKVARELNKMIRWTPSNIIYGPSSTTRVSDPGSKLDLEILDSLTSGTKALYESDNIDTKKKNTMTTFLSKTQMI